MTVTTATNAKASRPDISLAVCGYSKALDLISNKWTALIVYALEDGPVRYGELERRIEAISKKMLTQTLRRLERDGFLRREVTPSVPPIVEYSLTPLGETVVPLMQMLSKWTHHHYEQVEQARSAYDAVHGSGS
jgi:DNA-binding HxlR family transcriptional regulator